jgi:hypothetical protein
LNRKRYDGALFREAVMKFLRKTNLLAIVVLFFGFGSACVIQAGCALTAAVPGTEYSRGQKSDEVQAANALTRLGVPLQRDPHGAVRWIEAEKGEFSDEAMQYLPHLSQLEWLEIGGGSVSPSGITYLKDCVSLRRLYIHDIRLGNDELAWLSNLQNLKALSLQRTGITGKALKNLTGFGTLTVLNLSGDSIDDDDMNRIAQIKGLEVLALADTKITGIGIAKLEGMASLNELNMTHCRVYDNDLESFLSMPNLRIVYAEGCDLSDMAIQSVVARFPMLAIFR